jgi:hypothetical protein
MVHRISDDPLHIGFDQPFGNKKVQRNERIVRQHQTLGAFQQPASVPTKIKLMIEAADV